MKKFSILIYSFLLALYCNAQVIESHNSKNSNVLRFSDKTGLPSFVTFSDNYLKFSDFSSWIKSFYKTNDQIGAELIRTEVDKVGNIHYVYNQTYRGIIIKDAIYIVHTSGENVRSLNGTVYSNLDISNNITIPEKLCLQNTLEKIGAELYKWEIDSEEKILKILKKDESATYYPTAQTEIVIIGGNAKYCYKFDIYSQTPLSRAEYFVDAQNGEIIYENNLLKDTDIPGTAYTKYSGIKTIMTEQYNGSYRLRETGRGLGIETYNLHNEESFYDAIDFVDNDNIWMNYNPQLDEAATDAHWGAEMTYDYFFENFGRNSIDNNGFKLINLVHYYHSMSNAFWDGSYIYYGDGTQNSPYTCIDIVGHEICHGLNDYTADLNYSNESGALNEAFSDIFGTVVEFYAVPEMADWYLGEDLGQPIRSLENPNEYGLPDTYLGVNWATGTSDYGGVHTNCGVFDFWFYLLAEGGSGINDNGDIYSVDGIGIENAAEIAYQLLTVYLTSSSDYYDAAFYAIQASEDVFGICSPETQAVTNALYAVGLGEEFDNEVSADFTASYTYCCTFPAEVSFNNSCTNASSFYWDFGDGTTSTEQNPQHTYNNAGLYSVKLIAFQHPSCGDSSDTLFYTDYITISSNGYPISAICNPETQEIGYYQVGILRFNLNSIDNYTGGGTEGFCDYTCNIITELTEGGLYNINVNTGATLNETVKVWLDYNCDGVFNNSEELIFISENRKQFHSGSFLIPETILTDSLLRLRVGSDYFAYPIENACTEPQYGQFEDYSVIIHENTSQPEADFFADSYFVNIGQSVNFYDMSQYIPTSWHWEFEGGNPAVSELQNPSVTYSSLGTYSVKLIALNEYGEDSIVKTDFITVTQIYNLCDGVESTDALSGMLFDSGGPHNNYSNGDTCVFFINSSCANSIEFTINSLDLPGCFDRLKIYDGIYGNATLIFDSYLATAPVNLTATSGKLYVRFVSDANLNDAGFEASWTSEIDSDAIIAGFISSETNPGLNSPVYFIDTSSSDNAFYFWDFGDGFTSTEQNPTHYYMFPGIKNVSLIVDNCFSQDTAFCTLVVQDSSRVSLSPLGFNDSFTGCSDTASSSFVIHNNGGGIMNYDLAPYYDEDASPIEILACVVGISVERYNNSIVALNSQFTNYNLTELNSIDADELSLALEGKDILLFSGLIIGTATEYDLIANVLYEFVSAGGAIIVCGTLKTDCLSAAGLFSGSGFYNATSNLLSVLDNDNPITKEFPPVISGAGSTLAYQITNSDAVHLVTYENKDVVAFREINNGKIIYIGYTYLVYNTYAASLIANSVKWAGREDFANWIDFSSYSGSVAASDSIVIDVSINTEGVNSGTYGNLIAINTNDPINPTVVFPVEISVSGFPNIYCENNQMDFGQVMVYTTATDSVCIYNTGCDTLFISSIINNLSEFTITNSINEIMPGDSAYITVNFSPVTVTYFTDTILINNNDSLINIILSALSYPAPEIHVNQDTIPLLFSNCNENLVYTISIVNNGGSEMNYQIISGDTNTTTVELLCLTYGVDINREYPYTINAISTYFTDYNISEINTTNPLTLQDALVGKDVLLIAKQETGLASVFTDFAPVLQEFVDNGGAVIFCGTVNYNCIYNTGLLSGSGYLNAYSSSLNVIDTNHTLTENLPSTIPGVTNTCGLLLSNPDLITLVKCGDYDIVAYREQNQGRVVYLAYDYSYSNEFSAKIVANAVKWSSTEVPHPWLIVPENAGTVSAFDTAIVEIEINAEGFSNGIYNSNLFINSNDPLNPVACIPIEMVIAGEAQISLSSDNLNFTETMSHTSSVDSICIFNCGCDTLFISSIHTNLDEFTVLGEMDFILPGDSAFLTVVFSPVFPGELIDSLHIYNSVNNTSVVLTGLAYPAPIISVIPDSINAEIFNCNETLIFPITIDNFGESVLNFSITGVVEDDFITEVLALTMGVDLLFEYPRTLQAINQYFTDYNLTEINTTSALVLETALQDKDVFLIASQEDNTSVSAFQSFAPVLQNFVEQGGAVIFCATSHSNCIFNTGLFSGTGYFAVMPGNYCSVNDSLNYITRNLPDSIPTLNATYTYDFSNEDAVQLVSYNNRDVVTYREVGLGKVIYIGFNYYSYNDFTANIIANTIKWGGMDGAPDWLSASVIEGANGPGTSSQVEISFYTEGVHNGVYNSIITVYSNDPLNNQIQIPVELTVSALAQLTFEQDCINFSPIMSYTTAMDSVIIYNSGCDTIEITQLINSSPSISAFVDSPVLPPNDSAWLFVRFSPLSPSNIYDTIQIFCQDSMFELCVHVSSYDAPSILLVENIFIEQLAPCDDSVTLPLIIANGGCYNLIYNITGGGNDVQDAAEWITVSQGNGVVECWGVDTIYVTLSSQGLLGGHYDTTLVVNSNDPLYPHYNVFYHLSVPNSVCGDFLTQQNSLCNGHVNFIDISQNQPESWHWYFGDGTESFEQNPEHTYSMPGIYDVTLYVSNYLVNQLVTHQIIIESISGPNNANCTPVSDINESSFGISLFSLNSYSNLSMVSHDGYQDFTCDDIIYLMEGQYYSTNIVTSGENNKNIKLWIDYNNNGDFEPNESVFWIENSPSPHTGQIYIPESQNLNIPLRMRVACVDFSCDTLDPCGTFYDGEYEDYTIFIEPNSLSPQAQFNFEVLDSCQGVIRFTDCTSGIPTNWYWDFGDGTYSFYQNPYHSFENAGLYNVSLTVTNEFGEDNFDLQIEITSLNPNIFYQGGLYVNEPIQFTTDAIGVESWNWDFGDGNTSDLESPINIYLESGTYTVTLDVTNWLGCVAHDFIDIYIDDVVGISDAGNFDIIMYPNPAKYFTIVENNSDFEQLVVEILSVNNQVVHKSKIKQGQNKIPISDIKPGVYFVTINNNDFRITRKLVVMD